MDAPPDEFREDLRSCFKAVRALVVAGAGIGLGLFSRYKFRKMIDDFDVEYPAWTSVAFSIVPPILLGFVALVCVVLVLVVAFVSETATADRGGVRRIANIWHNIALGLALAVIAFYVAALIPIFWTILRALGW